MGCYRYCHVGRDVIAQAQSGTGKTATFVITILQQLEISSKNCQALVLAPTRELAQQVWSPQHCCYFVRHFACGTCGWV